MRKTFIGGVAAAALTAAALTAAAGGVFAGAATAQSPTPQPGAERVRFPRGDADQDGRISQAEFFDHRVARLTAADADADGLVTREEMRAAMQARRADRADRRFARLDADGDGAVTRTEFDAARGERGPRRDRLHRRAGADRGPVVIADRRAKLGERFARLDADSDGFVAADEQRAAREARREQRHERRVARRIHQPASPAPASE